jgi:hypothetical protein
MKIAALVFAAFVQAAALSAMPRNCFTLTYFGTCERVQFAAWAGLYTVNWESVNAIRSFREIK